MTTAARPERLVDRGVVAVHGETALAFLDRLVPADLTVVPAGHGVFTGLLSPQGKILVEFFVVPIADGLLLDTRASDVGGLLKRLTLYKLRAPVDLRDVSAAWQVVVAATPNATPGGHWIADPRHAGLGWRGLIPVAAAASLAAATDTTTRRVALGIAEGGLDYPIGDTYPHEANYDQVGAVSFSKGCFVGQEVVARMQHKTVVRKRVVRIRGARPLAAGAVIRLGDAEIGRLGSVAGVEGLAFLRLDRAVEAHKAGQPLTVEDGPVTVDAAAIDHYTTRLAAMPKVDL
jgi:hypothetical protein